MGTWNNIAMMHKGGHKNQSSSSSDKLNISNDYPVVIPIILNLSMEVDITYCSPRHF